MIFRSGSPRSALVQTFSSGYTKFSSSESSCVQQRLGSIFINMACQAAQRISSGKRGIFSRVTAQEIVHKLVHDLSVGILDEPVPDLRSNGVGANFLVRVHSPEVFK
mmetsp:Transcript_30886/g.49544  ORF Transcript_30886/g.49544 Transcript_30886/m.49544 type:complete len:107 (+) Transcript_30886:3232-3552(+)